MKELMVSKNIKRIARSFKNFGFIRKKYYDLQEKTTILAMAKSHKEEANDAD